MSKHAWEIKDIDVTYLDKLLRNEQGYYQSVPVQQLKEVPIQHLQLWATNNGVYQIVTNELLDWLAEEIGEQKAIEIGAGTGAICRSLGITGTDLYLHEEPWIKAYYEMIGHATTKPPPFVLKYEASEAARVLRPHTVVGAFITQYGTQAEADQGIPCSMFGVREMEMLKMIKKYICIGNAHTHKSKRIFCLPHKEYHFDWLLTKAFDQSLNRIWVWENE
jgi:hypothetical protein